MSIIIVILTPEVFDDDDDDDDRIRFPFGQPYHRLHFHEVHQKSHSTTSSRLATSQSLSKITGLALHIRTLKITVAFNH